MLTMSSLEVQYLCRKDKRLAKVIAMVGSIDCHTHDNPYAFLIHEIIEQMLSTKAGAKIYARMESLCGGKITPATVSVLSDEEIKSIGTSNSKVTYIRSITNAVISGTLDFSSLSKMTDDEVLKKLKSFRGIGEWTANMYLIFVLNRPDILPTTDAAFLQAYCWIYNTQDRNKASVIAKCKKWRPYSSTAARYLYYALDSGLTKKKFHLYK